MKQYLTPCLLTLLVSAAPLFSHAGDWSSWQKLNDGALNGIEFSFSNNCPPAGASDCVHRWRFSSNYDGDVTVDYTLAWDTGTGIREKIDRIRLNPGENRGESFSVIGRGLEEVSLKIVAEKQVLAAARKELGLPPGAGEVAQSAAVKPEVQVRQSESLPILKADETEIVKFRKVVAQRRRATAAPVVRRRTSVKRAYVTKTRREIPVSTPHDTAVSRTMETYLDSTILGYPVCP
jgi:hypothetical protein